MTSARLAGSEQVRKGTSYDSLDPQRCSLCCHWIFAHAACLLHFPLCVGETLHSASSCQLSLMVRLRLFEGPACTRGNFQASEL